MACHDNCPEVVWTLDRGLPVPVGANREHYAPNCRLFRRRSPLFSLPGLTVTPILSRLTIALLLAPVVSAAVPAGTAPQLAARAGGLDAFMARVLERRDEAWKKLHDYVLSETERFEMTGPAGARLYGTRREFTWYVRDGYLIRSPIRFEGVAIAEADRRKYEENWLNEEKAREAKRVQKEAAKGEKPAQDENSLQGLVDQRGEPRFISEAFFLKFKFEAGNYYLVGRERLDGRDVVRVEYYPTNLFKAHENEDRPRGRQSPQDAEMERRIQRDLNKVALVTLWIDPAEYQVVRYTFDNVDFGFLPARWLVRVDTITASMTMARVLDGVWLPHEMTVQAGITLATGSYAFNYGRELYDYKKAETAAKIRSIGGVR